MNDSRIKQTVLRRARIMQFARPLMSGTVLGGLVAVFTLYAIGREVWVAQVLTNIPTQSGVFATVRFFEIAFLNTSFAVQILSVLLVAGMLWVARDIARNIQTGLRAA